MNFRPNEYSKSIGIQSDRRCRHVLTHRVVPANHRGMYSISERHSAKRTCTTKIYSHSNILQGSMNSTMDHSADRDAVPCSLLLCHQQRLRGGKTQPAICASDQIKHYQIDREIALVRFAACNQLTNEQSELFAVKHRSDGSTSSARLTRTSISRAFTVTLLLYTLLIFTVETRQVI